MLQNLPKLQRPSLTPSLILPRLYEKKKKFSSHIWKKKTIQWGKEVVAENIHIPLISALIDSEIKSCFFVHWNLWQQIKEKFSAFSSCMYNIRCITTRKGKNDIIRGKWKRKAIWFFFSRFFLNCLLSYAVANTDEFQPAILLLFWSTDMKANAKLVYSVHNPYTYANLVHSELLMFILYFLICFLNFKVLVFCCLWEIWPILSWHGNKHIKIH